ncbi:acyltransferase [Gracilibacillus alcaliphilus]|uniref:acyltransferase n=1 Tax=Gracilibacillus alcaliphilus TaxID=1401441 RepID=UPI00195D4AD3|nr:acyltransferase [Gracilibacillus alcaliphilus]MBM7679277.1 surface polysaccharide O-acyltransferase-like enzyme [Gracilibacillus alcaliphilus]
MNKYYDEIPYIRAIACIMVVLVHVSANSYSNSHFADFWSLYINQYSRLGTPVFAVISGFLLFHSVNGRSFRLSRFLKSRTAKIVLPFIIWSMVYLVIRASYGEEVFTSMRQFLGHFVYGSAQYHLYFIVTVIQFYLIFPLLQIIKNRRIILWLFFVSIPMQYWWFQAATEVSLRSGIVDNIIHHHSFLLYWLSYFIFGGVLQFYYHEIKEWIAKYKYLVLSAFIITLVLIFREIEQGSLIASSRAENMLYVPVFVLFLLMTFPYLSKYSSFAVIWRLVGSYSMGIYLVHPLIIFLLDKINPLYPLLSYQIVLVFLLVLTLSILLIRCILFLPLSNYIIPVGRRK